MKNSRIFHRYSPIVCAILFLLFLFSGCDTRKGNTTFQSFQEVKDILEKEVYHDHRISFYCGCHFSKNKKVRCKTGEGKRAKTIEWEHVVPASRFGNTFESWESSESWQCRLPVLLRKILFLKCRKYSGRENARRGSEAYRLMESDMHNLVPAVGLINQRRSNRLYGIIPGEVRAFGRCDFEVADDTAEPAPHIRGDIARIYYYMAFAYEDRMTLSEAERQMFQVWDMEDPVDEWECERSMRIERIQDNVNPYVEERCREAGLW